MALNHYHEDRSMSMDSVALADHLANDHRRAVQLSPKSPKFMDHDELLRLHRNDHNHHGAEQPVRGTMRGARVSFDDIVQEDTDKLARHFVDQMGMAVTETNVEQMTVYMEAMELFIQRNQRYEDLWQQYGWMDTLTHIRSKALRLLKKFWKEDPEQEDNSLLDDALDLLNYTVFFIRNFRKRNKWGW